MPATIVTDKRTGKKLAITPPEPEPSTESIMQQINDLATRGAQVGFYKPALPQGNMKFGSS